MALNGLFCADVPLGNYSLIHSGIFCVAQLQTLNAAFESLCLRYVAPYLSLYLPPQAAQGGGS